MGSTPVVIAGRYELLELVGTGAMGSVFVAQDLLLERVVALKRLHTIRPDDEVALARFAQEARSLAGFDHRGLPHVYDFGEERNGPMVHPFLVMRFVQGDPLSEVLQRDSVLGVPETVQVVVRLAEALALVHEAGIVHRDVKPGNIVLQPDGQPVLVDFGIALAPGVAPLTYTGEILGTMSYISPEQVTGARAVAGSDIYSLGVVGYQCLTGHRPFEGDSPVAAALAHINQPVPEVDKSVPADFRALLRSMMAKNPADRPTAAEVAVFSLGA